MKQSTPRDEGSEREGEIEWLAGEMGRLIQNWDWASHSARFHGPGGIANGEFSPNRFMCC